MGPRASLLILTLGCAMAVAGVTAYAPAVADAKGKKSAKKLTKKLTKKEKKALRKAKRYSKKGKRAYLKERWDDAIASFKLAYDVSGQPKFLFNIGRSYEMKGDLVTAVEYVRRYVDTTEDEEEKEDGAERLNILKTRLQESRREIRVVTSMGLAKVELTAGDDRMSGETPFVRWVPLGAITIEVSLEEHGTARKELNLGPGDLLEVKLDPEPKAEGEPKTEGEPKAEAESEAVAKTEPVTDEPTDTPPSETDGATPWLPWAAVGGGVALAATGAAFAVSSSQAKDRRDAFKDNRGFLDEIQAEHDQAESDALIANILFATGGAVVIAGVVLMLSAGDDDAGGEEPPEELETAPEPEAPISLEIIPTPHTVTLGVTWAF